VRLRQAGEDCKHLLNVVIGKERATSVGKAAHRSGWTGTISSVTLRYFVRNFAVITYSYAVT
jgi:hypothetical protein